MTRRWKALATSAALSALFLICYPLCNWITSRRSNVPSLHFQWERHIPFLPSLIIPYMSIDLFFVAAPFLARSDRQRTVFAWRIAAAILIASACFLAFPLRFAFPRPHVNGFCGVIFNNFRALDQPFNQCPSLHIALCAILAEIYLRSTRGVIRWSLAIWFLLIAISPLVTYQHHVIDILGGGLLAVLCFHFFREQPLRQEYFGNARVGGYYAAGSAVFALLAFTWRPWSLVLLWPAMSCAMVAAGYWFFGPGVYRKESGRLIWSSWLLLFPVLIGQRLSRAHYALRCNPWDRMTDRVWIGRALSASEGRRLRECGVTAIVDLNAEFSEPAVLRDIPYLPLPILDLTPPTPRQLDQAIDFVGHQTQSGIVYIHCKIGYSRTAAVAGAYLLASGQASDAGEAIALLRRARPSIIIRPEAKAAVGEFAARQAARGCAAAVT